MHHDLWDYDLASQPLLFEHTLADGSFRPAVAQATKMGFVFVLDRETGNRCTRSRNAPCLRATSLANRRRQPSRFRSYACTPPIVATQSDASLRAHDGATGEVLWSRRLPAAAHATPMGFRHEGMDYIVVTAGGDLVDGEGRGDHVVAYRIHFASP